MSPPSLAADEEDEKLEATAFGAAERSGEDRDRARWWLPTASGSGVPKPCLCIHSWRLGIAKVLGLFLQRHHVLEGDASIQGGINLLQGAPMCHEATRPRGHETTRPRGHETTRPRHGKVEGLSDHGYADTRHFTRPAAHLPNEHVAESARHPA